MSLVVFALLLGFAATIAVFSLAPKQRGQMLYNISEEDEWYPLKATYLLTIAYAVPIYLLLLLASWVR